MVHVYVIASPPSAEYKRQWIRYALVQIMACRLFCTSIGLLSIEILIKIQYIHLQKFTWKHRLRKGGHFAPGEMSYTTQNRHIVLLYLGCGSNAGF